MSEDLSNSCVSCKFFNGHRIDHLLTMGTNTKLRCGILSTPDKSGRTREQFIPNCPCRSCLIKMVCPYDYRMIFNKGTKCCSLFQEFMGEILDHYYKLWKEGKLRHVEQIHLGREYED